MTKKNIVDEGIRLGFWSESSRSYLMTWKKALLLGQLESKKALREWREANGWGK